MTPPTVARMIVRVRRPLGMTDPADPDMLDSDVEEYLNMAFWEIMDKFPFREKERTGTFLTVAGTRNYEMPTPFECLRALAVVDPVTLQHRPLDQMTVDEYEQVYNENTCDQGKPIKYLREECFARLWPTPDQVYTIWMRRNTVLADLDEVLNNTLVIPQVWSEIIIYGAVWRALIDLGDIARATAMKSHQVSLLDTVTPVEQKEDADNSRAGVDVLGRDYDQCHENDYRRYAPFPSSSSW